MSIVIFAGSGQFIGISMLSSGASFLSIVLTIFMVNLRHMLYSSALIPYFKDKSKRFLMFFSYGITDETFVVNLSNFKQGCWDSNDALKVNIIANIVWVISNVLGSILGNVIFIDTTIISYALIAMFIGLWVYHLNKWPLVISGIISGIFAIFTANIFSNKLNIVIATIFAATIGCILEIKEKINHDE